MSSGPAAPGPLSRRFGRSFGVLGVRNFRWYWIATVAYYVGFFGDQLARNWLAYHMTGSALLLGYVVVSQGVPQALLAVIGGTLADRVPKKRLLVVSQVLLAAAAVTQSGLLLLHLTQYWHVVGLALVNGAAVGLSLPARLSFVGEVVSKDDFVPAYSLYYVANSTMRVAGPAIGGIVTAVAGVTGVYVVIAAAHVVALVLLFRVQEQTAAPAKSGSSFFQDLVRTYQFALGSPTILILMSAALGIVCFSFSSLNLMPVFAAKEFDAGAGGLGTLLAAVGVGGIVGSFLIAATGGVQRKPLLLLMAGAGEGVALMLFAALPVFWMAVVVAGTVGVGSAIYTTLNSTMFQLNAPANMRGRVMSLYMLSQALQPVGVLPVSILADSVGVRIAVITAGGLLVCFMAVVGAAFPRFRQARM